MKLIDKDALLAEINKLTRENELYLDENTSDAVRFQKTGAYSVLCDLRHFLDTLEVKEVEKVTENIIDAELYSDGMLTPLIGVKDKEKLNDIKFGDKVKLIIIKDK